MQAIDVEKILDELTQTMLHDLGSAQLSQFAIIGIRTGGEKLAEAIAKRVEAKTKFQPPLGMLDITLYRDDLDYKEGKSQPTLRATEVPFDIDGKRLLLVDDVLYTGRTVRAALNALSDLGRPAKIELLVLIDRGFRELPIRPDYVGTFIETQRHDKVQVLYDSKKGWAVNIRHGA